MRLHEVAGISFQIADIVKRLELMNSTKKEGGGRKWRSLLNALKSHIVLLDARLKRDECVENPCQNGGTCIDLYNKFMCICPAHYEVRGIHRPGSMFRAPLLNSCSANTAGGIAEKNHFKLAEPVTLQTQLYIT